VIKADSDVFDGIAAGRVNAMVAHLRGLVTVEGDAGLALALERLLPGPPDRATGPGVHR
jgi:putative sterol carrier protein